MNRRAEGWSAKSEALSEFVVKAFFCGLALAVAIAMAVIFWPEQSYGDCVVQMAEKAQGNATIFQALHRAKCYPKSPAGVEDQLRYGVKK